MKYLRRFNESIEEQIYNQVLDSIKDCFQEFEDDGWYWSESTEASIDAIFGSPGDNHLSYYPIPHFKYIMKKREDEYITFNEWEKTDRFEFTGSMDSNSDIKWDDKKGKETEEYQDFIVAIKRLQEEIGLDFKFSYNNLGGEKRIIIQGRI